MTEYQVDLSKANFNFDLDLLEHVHTYLPQATGDSSLFFDHQNKRVSVGDDQLMTYPQVKSCYWQPVRPALECYGPGVAYRFHDPAMDATQAKEILFRLANICEWNPQSTPPAGPQKDEEVEAPFDAKGQFRLPRESTMQNFVAAGDWTKADEFTVTHLGQPLAVKIHDSKNEILLNGQVWHRMDECKEAIFKRQEDRVEFCFPDARWGVTIGSDRVAQLVETRIKSWARGHHWAISEAQPEAGRNQLILKVDLLKAILEGGQIRLRGQREVLLHHGQQCMRIDGEVYGYYKDVTQMRIQMVGDRLSVRIWMQPKTLVVLESTAPCDGNTARIPDFLRALVRGVGVPVEE